LPATLPRRHGAAAQVDFPVTAYYNEIDPYAAQWLRNLIAAGHITPGDVDERSIVDVRAGDLQGYTQCHFFAGIGGWSYALQLAGWPAGRPVWTGSPPCQDASLAGAIWGVRKGLSGFRTSLVRPWLDLIDQVLPGTIYFENVPGFEKWAAEVEDRMAGTGYRLCKSKRSAADVGSPHLRRRMWIAAYRHSQGQQEPRPRQALEDMYRSPWRTPPGNVWIAAPGRAGGFADGFPARVAAIRAYGNAIVPQVAAEFIRASQES
jgi:DNA (cytosine-5)-methyltransferase 1